MAGWLAGWLAGRGSDYNASQPNWVGVGAELGKNGKPKFTWTYFFTPVQRFVRNLPKLCGLFHPYQCSYKLNRRTLADAQKDL